MKMIRAVLLLAAVMPQVATGLAVETSANPIRRVVTMLQSMSAKIEEEAKKEESLYEKYMCYCKTNGGSLEEDISAAEVKIPQVASSLDEKKASKAALEQALKEAQVGRDDAKAAIASAEAVRSKEASSFSEEAEEYKTNIAALAGAIDAIGKGISSSFLQSSTAQAVRRVVVSSSSISSVDREQLTAFLENRQGYVPQSGEILGLLKEIKDGMEKDLAEITGSEEQSGADSAALITAKTKEVAALTSAIEEKSTRIGQLGVEIAEMTHDLEDTKETLAEDQAFLADLQKNCATKESEWTEISKSRSEELTAIAETIKILNDDDALELFKKTLPSPSLMQVAASNKQQRSKALAILRRAEGASHIGQNGLDLITFALSGKKVSFDKVFKLIDELVETLAKEQQDDDHKKEYCGKQFDQTEDKKKGLEQELKDLSTSADDLESTIATLTEEMKSLEASIKVLDKSVAEATETRKEEHEAYTELISSNSAAKELIGIAKNRLQKFYNPALYKPPPKRVLSEEEQIAANFGEPLPATPAPGGIAGTGVMALVQIHAHNAAAASSAPPPPPEAFAPYAKKAEMSNGIFKLLDMLVADLDKEMTEAEADEKNSQASYEKFLEDAAESRALDSKAFTNKELAKSNAGSQLETVKEGTAATKKEKAATEEYLSSLHSECDWLLKFFDMRKTARAEEVDALKAAKAVLSGADYS